jgi:hypothetical protein
VLPSLDEAYKKDILEIKKGLGSQHTKHIKLSGDIHGQIAILVEQKVGNFTQRSWLCEPLSNVDHFCLASKVLQE